MIVDYAIKLPAGQTSAVQTQASQIQAALASVDADSLQNFIRANLGAGYTVSVVSVTTPTVSVENVMTTTTPKDAEESFQLTMTTIIGLGMAVISVSAVSGLVLSNWRNSRHRLSIVVRLTIRSVAAPLSRLSTFGRTSNVSDCHEADEDADETSENVKEAWSVEEEDSLRMMAHGVDPVVLVVPRYRPEIKFKVNLPPPPDACVVPDPRSLSMNTPILRNIDPVRIVVMPPDFMDEHCVPGCVVYNVTVPRRHTPAPPPTMSLEFLGEQERERERNLTSVVTPGLWS